MELVAPVCGPGILHGISFTGYGAARNDTQLSCWRQRRESRTNRQALENLPLVGCFGDRSTFCPFAAIARRSGRRRANVIEAKYQSEKLETLGIRLALCEPTLTPNDKPTCEQGRPVRRHYSFCTATSSSRFGTVESVLVLLNIGHRPVGLEIREQGVIRHRSKRVRDNAR